MEGKMEKKISISEMTAEVGYSLCLSWMLSFGTLECFPTIEMMRLFPFLLESAASSSLSLENCSDVDLLYYEVVV